MTLSTARRYSRTVHQSCEAGNRKRLSLFSLIFCVILLAGGVRAQNPLVFNTPQNLTLCAPTNITWSGGVPPFRLDIEPFSPDDGTQEPSLDQRFLNITVQWLIWTPNFTAGTDVQFNLIDSTESGLAGGHHLVRLGSDTSCLPGVSSSASLLSSSTGSSSSAATSTTGSPTPDVLVTHHGLGPGAVAGIAVGVAIAAVMAIAVIGWCLLRKRRQARRYKDFDVDRAVASPTLSDATTAVMHENYPGAGICSTLASTDHLSKTFTDTGSSPTHSRFASYSGPSSPTLEIDPSLRPTPYLVPRSSSPGLTGSVSDLRRGRKSARDTVAGSTNVSTADLRSATPTQMSDTGSGAALPSPRTIRFVEADGGVRLAGGGVEELARDHEHEAGDVVSDAGTSSLPPPYSPYQ
ncbi:hypothetical protein K466DRAFT_564280 [Polyporus arcularius HHB13444]|uniref:Mid2 domain-containing protein n=1 Tax=Polyporus arcularius HHB13444 TaxID=1314778 RepID=A0A5C3PJY7_9APHY|nr:hypothetical protein K466DRAFT_564280 [Polyporus arcularius HHB13444]